MLIVKFYFQNLEIFGSDACYVYVAQNRSFSRYISDDSS